MTDIVLNSSALLGCSYDPQRELLLVRFRTGERYLYHNVPAVVIQDLLRAPSQGQYFNSAIRARFPSDRLS